MVDYQMYVTQFVQFSQQIDMYRLLLIHMVFTLPASLYPAQNYNLPIFLFGIWTYHYHESSDPLKQFTGFLVVTILLDIAWFVNNGIGAGILQFLLLLMSSILKPVTILSSLNTIKMRGEGFSASAANEWTSQSNANPYQVVADGD